MTYRIFYRASAESDLNSLPDPAQTEIRTAIKSLTHDPRPPGCKKLVAMSTSWRIRVGRYRIAIKYSTVR